MNPSTSKQTRPSPPTTSNAASAPGPEPDVCANCGTVLRGTYCVACGQRATNRIVPLWQVTNEFLEDLFDLDLRILRTFPTFFLQPGQLTVEYLRGRRRRYIRPLRLYLFSSFLLFTVLALTNVGNFSFSFPPATDEAKVEVDAVRAEVDAIRAELALQQAGPSAARSVVEGAPMTTGDSVRSPLRTRSAPALDEGFARVDEALAALGPLVNAAPEGSGTIIPGPVTNDGDTEGRAPLEAKLLRILTQPSQFVRDMLDWAPFVMFLLVPTFALLLKLLYLRRKRLYLEHLIFALHVHALAFIVFAVSATIGAFDIGSSMNLDGWMAAAPFGYVFFAVRRVYGQSFGTVAMKTIALLCTYGIILVCSLVLLVISTIALM